MKTTNNKLRRNILVVIGIAVLAAIFVVIVFFGREKTDTVKIGFIMSGSANESGWNGNHYNAMKRACDKMSAELLLEENVKEFTGECEKSIQRLINEGAEMIVLSSYGYGEEAKDIIEANPGIVFFSTSSENQNTDMTYYFVRMYQARYLSGIVAGMTTKTNKIGYVAAMSNCEVNRGINAFTLGVQRVNPDAEVIVSFTGAWDDAEKEKKVAEDLIDECEIDVITYHQNQPNVVEVAETKKVASIGYHEKPQNSSEYVLTAAVCDWNLVYEQMLEHFLQTKTSKKEKIWLGVENHVIGLETLSTMVEPSVSKEIEEAKKEIVDGKDVFSGVIYDTEGKLRCRENESVSDEKLLKEHDWYVKGVTIYENKM